jgi:hypothetical protein
MSVPVPVFLLALVLSLSLLAPSLDSGGSVQAAELGAEPAVAQHVSQEVAEPEDDRVPVMIWTFMAALGVMLLAGLAYLLKQRLGGFGGDSGVLPDSHRDDHAHEAEHAAATH